MTAGKPVCSLSLDLDNKWSYMKTHGDAGWESFPSYLDIVVPRFLEVLDEFGWKITVFVVGQDAALEENHEALKMIADAGHEIGNHSFNHEPWLHLYSKQQILEEIRGAEAAIGASTGEKPIGFRGPGFSISRAVLEILAETGYLYDASLFPTFLGPLARTYYFLKSDFQDEEKEKRKELFGGFREGLDPIRPFEWELGTRSLIEIPVTTMPIFRVPIHFSYILFVSGFSHALAKLYFRTALAMCRRTHISPSILLHPLDFLTEEDVPELAFFPAMKSSYEDKTKWLNSALGTISSSWRVARMGDFATSDIDRPTVRRIRADGRKG